MYMDPHVQGAMIILSVVYQLNLEHAPLYTAVLDGRKLIRFLQRVPVSVACVVSEMDLFAQASVLPPLLL